MLMDKALRAVADPTRLAEWLGPPELDARPGGILRVQLEDGPRPMLRGEFVELVPYRLIVFTFGWERTPGDPDIPAGASRVEVALVRDGDGTRLTLRHSGVPATLEGETNDGWALLLRRLGTVVALVDRR